MHFFINSDKPSLEEQKALTERKLKNYYKNKRELERLNYKLDTLCRHRDDVQRDIDKNNISLKVELPNMDFGCDRVQSSSIGSPQERAVDSAFAKLEHRLKTLTTQILEEKESIRELELEVSDIEFLVGKLTAEARNFITLRYEERKSFKAISIRLHISETSVWRLRDSILETLSKWHTHTTNEKR